MKSKDTALLLIFIGVAWLFCNYFGWTQRLFENAWVIVFWVIGLAFEIGGLSGPHKRGLLVPAGIFLTLGFIFSFCGVFGYRWMDTLWPLFIFAPAVGLFQMYLFGGRNGGLLVPVGVLSAIGGFFLFINIGGTLLLNKAVPALLIVLGIVFLILPKKTDN